MSHEKLETGKLQKYRELYHNELYQSVIPFWMHHSLDREHGGYFNCLDRDGKVYDEKKHVWLQGRQVWMLSRLHNHFHSQGEESEYLDAARLGMDFLRKHAREGNRVYFCLTRVGGPVYMQRKIFSECFYAMALAEYARASGDESAREEAREMFGHIDRLVKDPAPLGRPIYPNLPETSELAIPMILLNLIDEINDPGENNYQELAEWCVERIHLHIRPELSLVLETVGADGNLIDTPEGRTVNPGHALETGWFLLNYAEQKQDEALVKTCLNVIDWSFDFGWDEKHNGLLYFLDRDGFSPVQLEWSLKLWWPHCEAVLAFLKAYNATRDVRYFKKFEHVTDYTFKHFPDPEQGEWYGYLTRQGEVNQRFKGGPYKGCFHVPRALFLCDNLIQSLIQEQEKG